MEYFYSTFRNLFDFSLNTENALLIGSIMLFLSILAGKAGYKTGLPILLLFLGIGMAMGEDGLGLKFSDARVAQFIGTVALSIILFSGGMDTKIENARPVWKQGLILSTIGVFLTALITGGFIYSVSHMIGGNFELSFCESLLLASVMSSTDSASVFSLLRSSGLNLDKKLRSTLELESGSNDPMAYILTILLIEIVKSGSFDAAKSLVEFAVQLSFGLLFGYVLGRITVFLLNKINIDNAAMYSSLLLGSAIFTFSITNKFAGNGYLAVYVAGLAIGNSKFSHKRAIAAFFESFAWLWQIIMFLALGLLVNPCELLNIFWIGLAIAAFMTIAARPLAVFLCLFAFKMKKREKSYISWVGLKGAVPIIFATYPLIANVEKAQMMFNIVFFTTLVSLLVQGTTVAPLARKFGLVREGGLGGSEFGVELSEDIKSSMSEIEISEKMLENGSRLMDLRLPENTLVVMVKRNGNYFVPQGKTSLSPKDKVLVISDKGEELEKIYAQLGIENRFIDKGKI